MFRDESGQGRVGVVTLTVPYKKAEEKIICNYKRCLTSLFKKHHSCYNFNYLDITVNSIHPGDRRTDGRADRNLCDKKLLRKLFKYLIDILAM